MNRTVLILAAVLAGGPVLAQSHQPYADLQGRDVKAFSDQQVADLRAGRGMGLALPAELNGYPGPVHVLEHADAMKLSAEQRKRTEALHEAMTREAIPLGERLIDQEARLDRLFARREITPESLSAVTGEIAATQGSLREAHLKYHLVMMDVLVPDQVARYRELRGYGAQGHGAVQHRRSH